MAHASRVFNIAKKDVLDSTIDLATDVLKVMLCMTNSTAGTTTNQDADTVGAITTIDEFDNATGYTAGGEVVTTTAVSVDDTDNEGVFDAADQTWTAVAAGTRKIDGCLIYKVTGMVPICYVKFNTSFAANGGDITINWSSEGILNLTD
jgi:hypothetical protein